MAFTPPPIVPDRADKVNFPTRMYNMWVWFVATIAELSTLGSAYNLATSCVSSSSNTIGTGTKNFTVPTGLGFLPGMPLNIAYTTIPTNSFFGYVTSYNSGTGALVMNITSVLGSGTQSAWTISLAASAGGATLGANIFTALQRWFAGADIASAATIDLTAATGNTKVITGAVTTGAFTMTAGQWMFLIAPAGWKITFNATTANIAGGVDYLCRAGDRLFLCKDNNNVIWITPKRQDGSAISGFKIPVRQTVLNASVDANGLPTFMSGVGTTTLTIAGSAGTPFVATAANGFDINGQVDRVGIAVANLTLAGQNVNGTYYDYVDIAVDGVMTLGATALAPTYRTGGADVITNGQFTFNNLAEMLGKVGNGVAAVQTYRVFIGEHVVASNVISTVTPYGLQARYDSGFTATLPAAGVATSKNSNLGVADQDFELVLECTTTEGGYAVGDRMTPKSGYYTGALDADIGLWTTYKTIGFTAANNTPFYVINKTTGIAFILTAANWKWKLVAERKWQ